MPSKTTCPLSHTEAVDRYFLEHRAKVLDIAAFLDRLDRCESVKDDYRIDALRSCIQVLLEENNGRAENILNILSDLSKEPIDSANEQGASGAPRINNQSNQ
ncbi:MAG: hypothetical protein QGF07_04195 [Phycisphaerales bacterium]|jgi:hypothetical protein|nr:hypothetical protein [Phycisphaerales bacterium]